MKYQEEFDLSGLKDLQKRLTKINNSHLKYGWLNKSMHKIHGITRKVPTAQIIFWNEFGTRTIPARPYLTITSLVLQTKLAPFVQEYFCENILNKDYSDEKLYSLEHIIKNEFKKVKGTGQALAESTIRKKNSSTHWVETGQALDEFEVKLYKTKLIDKE